MRLFRLRTSTHKIALGLSLGFLPNWIPSFGIGPFLSLALGKIFRTNLTAAFIGGIAGTFAWPFMFYLNYRVGAWALSEDSEVSDIDDIAVEAPGEISSLDSFGLQFIYGMMINSVVCAIFSYIVFFIVFKKYRLALLAKVRKM